MSGGLDIGGSTTISDSSTTINISNSVIKVEQFCQASASNSINISITAPPGCPGGGVDIINPTISQNSDSNIQSCSNTSYYEALLRLAITNDLSASKSDQLTSESLASLNLPSAGIGFNNTVATNAYNKTVENTNYSSLQQCRGHAQNIIRINITDCAATRDIGGTMAQTSSTELNSCVNNSSAVTNFALSYVNDLKASSAVTNANPINALLKSIGNIIMVVAIALAAVGVILSISSAVKTVITTKAKAHLMEKELELRGSAKHTKDVQFGSSNADTIKAAGETAGSLRTALKGGGK